MVMQANNAVLDGYQSLIEVNARFWGISKFLSLVEYQSLIEVNARTTILSYPHCNTGRKECQGIFPEIKNIALLFVVYELTAARSGFFITALHHGNKHRRSPAPLIRKG